MKKILLGCAVVFVLFAVGGAFVLYQFVYKPGREMVRAGSETLESFSRLGELETLEEGVADRSPYLEPADGRLTAEQVEGFVAVQRRVRGELGPRWEVLQAKYESGDAAAAGGERGIGELMAFWRDLGDVAVDAKRSQVAALNEAGLSLGEYQWVRRQVYLALGLESLTVGFDEVVAAAREGGISGVEDLAEGRDALTGQAPPENVALVEPYRTELQEWAPLALLGL